MIPKKSDNIVQQMKQSFKSVYKSGAKDVNKLYGSLAGRYLQQGDDKPMKLYNSVTRAIDKL